jgi:hypothetical protein
VGDLERAGGQARLVLELVFRGELVLLESRVDLRRVGQFAFQERGGDRDDLQAGAADGGDRAIEFVAGRSTMFLP